MAEKTVKLKSRRGLPLHWQGQEFSADENGMVELPVRIARAKGIMPAENPEPTDFDDERAGETKAELVEEAAALGIASKSTLKRWSQNRLRREIAQATGDTAEE